MAPISPGALHRLIGMIRTPRATLTAAVGHRRWLDLALLILVVSAACRAGFLMTRVGQLAALDQQVRQLESFGATVGDVRYEELRRVVPYRPLISAAVIFIGWPIFWLVTARILWWVGNRAADRGPERCRATFAEVLTVVVHASAILAVRAVVSTPINYTRESLGGATSLGMVMPAFGESTFPARLVGAVDVFVVWWVVLIAIGLSVLYQTRTLFFARWLFGAYVSGAAALALTQALRGGM